MLQTNNLPKFPKFLKFSKLLILLFYRAKNVLTHRKSVI